MMTMIGQKKLLDSLSNYNIDNFPHSVILQGERGSGRHLLCDYISKEVLNIPLVDITKNLSHELIDAIYQNSYPCLYLINSDELT